MKITIVGTGYVGLVTGVCMADTGVDVVCVDINEKKLADLREGILPIYEPGLDAVVARNVSKERLTFSSDLRASVADSDVVFIAVGTPPGEDGSADMTQVLQVARSIGEAVAGATTDTSLLSPSRRCPSERPFMCETRCLKWVFRPQISTSPPTRNS